MRTALTLILALALAAAPAAAQRNDAVPDSLREVTVEPRLGETLPLDLEFVDDEGAAVTLADLAGERPIILAPVYYNCPMLCTMVLRGVTRTLRVLEFEPGREFDLVAFSIDPTETPEDAARVKAQHLEEYGKPETAAGWRFLTGDADSTAALAQAVGFGFQYIEETGEYAHTAAIIVITPEGRVSSYHLGIDYPARDLRLALVEAAGGEIGSWVDQALLFCYRYDPTIGKYTFAAWTTVRVAGLLTLALLVAFLVRAVRRERSGPAQEAAA